VIKQLGVERGCGDQTTGKKEGVTIKQLEGEWKEGVGIFNMSQMHAHTENTICGYHCI